MYFPSKLNLVSSYKSFSLAPFFPSCHPFVPFRRLHRLCHRRHHHHCRHHPHCRHHHRHHHHHHFDMRFCEERNFESSTWRNFWFQSRFRINFSQIFFFCFCVFTIWFFFLILIVVFLFHFSFSKMGVLTRRSHNYAVLSCGQATICNTVGPSVLWSVSPSVGKFFGYLPFLSLYFESFKGVLVQSVNCICITALAKTSGSVALVLACDSNVCFTM